jgi:hypothetical protein
MLLSKKVLMSGIAVAALVSPALAEDRATSKQKEQYIYQQSQEQGLGADQGAIGQTKPNSGPGVQGFPDTRTGPSTRAPSGDGASSGEAGSDAMNKPADNATQPSQDSSGVQGFPDTRTGPATHKSGDASSSSGGSSGSGISAP